MNVLHRTLGARFEGACPKCQHDQVEIEYGRLCVSCGHLIPVPMFPIRPLRGPSPDAKPDEREMWEALLLGECPRDSGARLGIPEKRIIAVCHKWSNRGLYDYGVTAWSGWVDWDNRA